MKGACGAIQYAARRFPKKKHHTTLEARFVFGNFPKKKHSITKGTVANHPSKQEDLCNHRVFSTVVLGGMTCHPRFLGWFLGGIYATQDFLLFFLSIV